MWSKVFALPLLLVSLEGIHSKSLKESQVALADTDKNVTISKANSLSIEIVNPNQTVTIGSTFTLSCRITGSKIVSVSWHQLDYGGFMISRNSKLYVDSNRYSLSSPTTFPATQQTFFYNVTISKATFADTGLFACEASLSNLDSFRKAMVVMSGVPEIPAPPNRSLSISASSKRCCWHKFQSHKCCCWDREVSDECSKLLCTSSDLELWQPSSLPKCTRYVSFALVCRAYGQNNMPCCIRSGVSEKCLNLCRNQPVLNSSALTLDCSDEWKKLVTCFSQTNQLKLDPPFGVTARTLNSSSVEVTWLAANEIYPTIGYAVHWAHFNSTNTKLSDVDDVVAVGTSRKFNRLDITSETSVVVNNLKPMTRYAFFVITLAPPERSSPPSAVVEAVTSPDSSKGSESAEKEAVLKQCCKNKRVDKACADLFCTLKHNVSTLRSVVEKGVNCSSDIPKTLACMAGRYDHSKCCKLRHVPDRCLKFCVGQLSESRPPNYYSMRYMVGRYTSAFFRDSSGIDSLRYDDYSCLPYVNTMASCFASSKLPPPPESFMVTLQSNSPSDFTNPKIFVKAEWKRPKNYFGHVSGYLITLTDLSTTKFFQIDVPGSINSYILNEPFVTFKFDSMYHLQLAAENEAGLSLGVETEFRTPKHSNQYRRQSSVTNFMRSCCKSEMLPETCQTHCTANVNQLPLQIPSIRSWRRCFDDNWPIYAKCSALGYDISDCCSSVPSYCKKFCRTTGKMPFSTRDNWRCMQYSKEIFSCSMDKWPIEILAIPHVYKTMVPSAPKFLKVSSKSEEPTIFVNWSSPESGFAFAKYIVTFKAGEYGQENEVTVEPSTTKVHIRDVMPNVRYWVKVFTETHIGTRSRPAIAKSAKVMTLYSKYFKLRNISGVNDCCLGVSRNCKPICEDVLQFLANFSDITSRCPSDISQISRCSVLAFDVEARKANKYDFLPSCCLSHGISNKECCSIPTTANDLKPLPTCDNATSLAIIISCVSEQLKEISPSVIRNLTVLNITATRASLTWLPPEHNSNQVRRYTIQCQYTNREVGATPANSGWSKLMDTTVEDFATNFKFGEGHPLKAGTRTRCSAWVDGFESTKAEIMFESKDVDMKELELKLTDPESTFLHSPAEFQCITGEFAYSNITWLKAPFGNTFDKHMLPEAMVSINSTTLKIPRLEVGHSGVYSCKLQSSSSWQAPVYLSTDLKVRIKPQQLPTVMVADLFTMFQSTWGMSFSYKNEPA